MSGWGRGLAFSPDGRLLAVGSFTEVPLSLWDLSAAGVVGRLQCDPGQVESLAFSPDGALLAVAGYSTAALVCDVAALCGEEKAHARVKVAEPTAERLEEWWAELIGSDGARILFEHGWGLVRASNTQAILVLRFEADSEENLAQIREAVESKVQEFIGEV